MYPFTFTLLINLWSIYPFILLNQSIHPSTHPSIHTPFHASIYIPFHLLFTHSFTKPSIYLYTQTPFFGYCCCSVAKSYLTLWPRVLHHLPEFAQTHVHWISDAIQPSRVLSPCLLLPSVFPTIRFFPVSQLFASSGQSIGASASAPALPMNIQGWFPLGLTGLISLLSKGLSSLLQHYSSKASIFWCSAFFMVQLSHPYLTTGKTIALTRQTLLAKLCLCFLVHCLGLL